MHLLSNFKLEISCSPFIADHKAVIRIHNSRSLQSMPCRVGGASCQLSMPGLKVGLTTAAAGKLCRSR